MATLKNRYDFPNTRDEQYYFRYFSLRKGGTEPKGAN